jgi:small-conductance mechanosensitive channel
MTSWNYLLTWLQALGLFAAITAIGLGLHAALLRWSAKRPPGWHPFLRHALDRTRRLVRYMILRFAAANAAALLPISFKSEYAVRHIFFALFIVQLGWIAIVAANLAIDRYVGRLDLKASDNLLARKAATQMRIFRQAVNVMLGVLTIAFALMSFEEVRQFGISLFASAGVAGIVAGLAARPMLENLIAGVQLALTQPLRLEDAVVINNEWGWVEEINSTYIVVRLWDWRRQVVPLSYLFQNPFANWTRSSSSLIGTVYVYADYTLPMNQARAAATRIVKASPLWDGQVVAVQISDAKEQVIEVRVLASASDGGRAWDLRCEIREKLIAWIRDNHPESLPRVRREDFRLADPGAQPPAQPH